MLKTSDSTAANLYNTSFNGSGKQFNHNLVAAGKYWRMGFSAGYLVLFCCGLANVGVLCLIPLKRHLRTVNNLLVFHICLASIIYNSMLPFFIKVNLSGYWGLGKSMCKMVMGLDVVAKNANIYFIMLASVERFLLICRPPMWRIIWSLKNAFLMSIAFWVLSFTAMSPVFWFSDVITSNQSERELDLCQVKLTNNQRHFLLTYMLSISFVAPTAVILFSYTGIVLTMFFQWKRIRKYIMNSGERRRKRFSRYRKTTKTILMLIACYLACWVPYWLLNLFLAYKILEVPTDGAIKIMFNLIHMLPYVNCAGNPFLYAFMTENFKLFPNGNPFNRTEPTSRPLAMWSSYFASRSPYRSVRQIPLSSFLNRKHSDYGTTLKPVPRRD